MRIRVLYLGGSRGESGVPEEELVVPAGSTVADVAARVAKLHPALEGRLESVRWARNHEFARREDPIADGDEIALIPPVAGGAPGLSPSERVAIQTAPIDLDAVVAKVQGPKIGAVVTFIGTVRDHARGKEVLSLDYEAYEPMASRVLERIVADLERQIDGVRLAITHRTGLLPVGERSVVIAAASPHRDEAYRACRAALEEIKKDLPIWKRERTADGEDWVGWGGG